MDKNHRRQLRFYGLFRSPVSLFLKLKFHYYSKKVPYQNEPFIILANHCTGMDPIFIGCSFSNHVYFVAGEHVLRMGLASRFIKYMFDPIIKHKGFSDPACIIRIMKTLKQGYNVCLFAEGNTTFNGETCEIHPTTAKLIKSAASMGASLITYRFQGGYLSKPRWADSFRKGRITGDLIGNYAPEKITQMSDDEINSLIAIDLYEDAFATQETFKIPFIGKNLAMKLESALYICPKCQGISTLKSNDNHFYCECGLKVYYNELGLFEGSHLQFKNVLEWDNWQEEQLKLLSSTTNDTEIFSDEDITLYKIDFNHNTEIIEKGRMSLFSDRLVLGNWVMAVSKIGEMAIHGRENLVFSSGKDYYEFKSDKFFCARKYYSIFKYLKEKEN